MHLLHIVATPRAGASNSLRVSQPFLEALTTASPDLRVTTLDLFATDLPAVAGDNIDSKYNLMTGQPITPGHAESWRQIESLISQFVSADVILVSTPMWNFGIPYVLKYYIDCIVQPGYLFTYNEQGYPVGTCGGKKLVCITTRGGDYSEGGPMHAYDLQEPYLRTLFGFIGITDQQYIHAQPMDVTPELREAAITAAAESARDAAVATTIGLAPATPAR